MLFSAFAPARSCSGTRAGISAACAGRNAVLSVVFTNASPMATAGEPPANADAAMATITTARPTSATSMIRRRSKRSASAPPKKLNSA